MRRALAIGVVAVAVGGIAAIVAVGLRQGPRTEAVPPPADPLAVAATVEPSRALAGDTIHAAITLTVDTTRVDPESIEVGAFFRPFRQVGGAAVSRTELGATTIIRYRYPLQCLDRACALRAAERTIELPIGLIRYTPHDGDVVSLPLTWPTVTLESRLSDDARAALRSRPLSLAVSEGDQAPALVPAARADAVGWTFLGVAALLLVGVAMFALRGLRGAREPVVSSEPAVPRGSPLAGALRTLDEASDGPTRRVALDALALRLEEAGESGLAREARRLAWSERGPDAPELAAFRDAVARLGEEAA